MARPAASTYALQFEADKNVKKLTLKYAKEKHSQQKPARTLWSVRRAGSWFANRKNSCGMYYL